ncbi:MAG: aminotransferase class I/II-fold pyridoxal phosphate-dependent enzyme [Clostridiales bacterium]|nr:aminotransferase class I/II-fold pyridoxal phosphate-dependent enzyme [Clostridiales bacterium]
MKKIIKAPIVERIADYIAEKPVRWHMPGHKGNFGDPPLFNRLLPNAALIDAIDTMKLGDISSQNKSIKEAEDLAANLMQAGAARFLLNGASQGVMAAVIAACRMDEKILIARNSHRSAWVALVLSGAIPVSVPVVCHPEYGIALGVTTEAVAAAIKAHPDAKALLVTSPTYNGVINDLRAIQKLTKEAGMTLIVDEAHGNSFPFSDRLPLSAQEIKASLVVHSWHKTLGTLTQAAVLLQNDLSLPLDKYLRLLNNTSPSPLLLASLDATRAWWEEKGPALADYTVDLALEARAQLAQIEGIHVLGLNDYPDPVKDADITRLVISNNWNLSGFDLEEELNKRHVHIEMAESRLVTLMLTVGNQENDIRALTAALMDISANLPQKSKIVHSIPFPDPTVVLSPSEAYEKPTIEIPRRAAVGRIAGEMLAPYPPGIPLLAPGELITPAIAGTLEECLDIGAWIHGPEDPSCTTITVIADA